MANPEEQGQVASDKHEAPLATYHLTCPELVEGSLLIFSKPQLKLVGQSVGKSLNTLVGRDQMFPRLVGCADGGGDSGLGLRGWRGPRRSTLRFDSD